MATQRQIERKRRAIVVIEGYLKNLKPTERQQELIAAGKMTKEDALKKNKARLESELKVLKERVA